MQNKSKSVDPIHKYKNRLPMLPIGNMGGYQNANEYRSTFYNGEMSTARNTAKNSSY